MWTWMLLATLGVSDASPTADQVDEIAKRTLAVNAEIDELRDRMRRYSIERGARVQPFELGELREEAVDVRGAATLLKQTCINASLEKETVDAVGKIKDASQALIEAIDSVSQRPAWTDKASQDANKAWTNLKEARAGVLQVFDCAQQDPDADEQPHCIPAIADLLTE